MKIAAGSTNFAKIQAITNVFSGHAIIECNVDSGVSPQPFSDEETINGAINRAKNALLEVGADIGIGLEGGVQETPYGLMLVNYGALVRFESIETPIIAGGARILLPDNISKEVRSGKELGTVMDEFCQREDISHSEGAVGVFTNNIINRVEMFSHIVSLLRGQLEYRVTR